MGLVVLCYFLVQAILKILTEIEMEGNLIIFFATQDTVIDPLN
jgi:hypothetical protein